MFDGCPCTGGVGLCSDVIREYYVINTAMNWTDAQSYCRKKYNDLATVGNSENMMTLVSTATASGASREMWIGLRETGSASWLWSVGESENSSGVVEYTNWAKTGSASISSTCGAMRSDGKWLSSSCTTTRPFVCQSEKMIVARKIVGVELMSDSFLDFNNAAVTQDILNQVSW
uniref:C-type lectin domain-containing protein n=1 Tax=Amphiprion ocellaris TaxID=80972 RepID=A0A3Q1AJY8_AMPOC